MSESLGKYESFSSPRVCLQGIGLNPIMKNIKPSKRGGHLSICKKSGSCSSKQVNHANYSFYYYKTSM